ILAMTETMNGAYRVLELIATAVARQNVFVWLWPIGALSLLGIYFTVQRWGIESVLAFLILEGVLRLTVLMIFFRQHGAQAALDGRRSTIIVLIASVAVLVGSAFVGHGQTLVIGDILVAAVSMLVFVLIVWAVKPIRPLEYEVLELMVPHP